MASWRDILVGVLNLTQEVERLNKQTALLSERTIDIDKRVVRLETLIEVAQAQPRLPK